MRSNISGAPGSERPSGSYIYSMWRSVCACCMTCNYLISIFFSNAATFRGCVYLHGADAQAPVDDELAERRRALVAVAPVDHEEATQVFELSHGEVCSQRGLLSFLSHTHTKHRGSARTTSAC